MYHDALAYHLYGIVLLPLVIVLFYLYTQFHSDFLRYKKRIRLWMPIYVFALATTIFTGVVMMAAKQLAFDSANIFMIAVSIILIFLEVVRHKKLLATVSHEAASYVALAQRMYATQMLLLFATIYITKVLGR